MNCFRTDRPFCIICGGECQPVVAGLFDNRFGAPGSYHIVRCQNCDLEQTWPRLPEGEIKELYERYYNCGGEEKSTYSRLREWFMASGLYRHWLKWDGDISFHLEKGAGRLLDLGCNEGRGLAFYASNGFQVEGLEINEQAAALARRRGFTVYTTPLAEFNPESPYDVVVLSNVLEHALDPIAMLSQVRQLLKPKGQVWISCPNANSFWRRVCGRCWVQWHVPYHICHFSPQTLRGLLELAHFSILKIQTCTPAFSLAGSLCVLLGSRSGRANRFMRSAPARFGLTLAARSLLFFLSRLGNFNGRLAEDCLIVKAVL